MKPQAHTPTPWKTDGRSIFKEGESVIARTVEKSANAAFIVRAVNAHEELLKALRHIAYEPIGKSDATDKEMIEGMTEIAKQAIAKAEEK